MAEKLPDEEALNRRYGRLNHEWWDGQLPPVLVRWSARMRALAGKYWRGGRGWEVVLSLPYHRRFPEEVEGTLLHEMVHVWIHRQGKRRRGAVHGPEFRAEAARVGAPLHCRSYPDMHRPYRYEWECSHCGRRSKSRIRGNWACRPCC